VVFDLISRLYSPYQFNPTNYNPLRDVLEQTVDFERLRQDSALKLFLSATNVRTGKVKVFGNDEISADAVMASACLPFLFQAVTINGDSYWDGGYMGNPAIYPLVYRCESRDVVIVHINPIERPEVPTTARDILNRINEISFNSSLLRELRAIDFVHKLLDNGWIKDEYRDRLRSVRIHSIRSDKALEEFDITSKFRTDWSFLSALKEQGRIIADAWLEENFDLIGKRSSVNLRAMFDSSARKGDKEKSAV
jgi:NTE family protein